MNVGHNNNKSPLKAVGTCPDMDQSLMNLENVMKTKSLKRCNDATNKDLEAEKSKVDRAYEQKIITS